MANPFNSKKLIESEMDRFEKEISSLAPTMGAAPSFIPAQLRKTPTSAPVAKPSPIIISGAPQVYNPNKPNKPTNPTTDSSTGLIFGTPMSSSGSSAVRPQQPESTTPLAPEATPSSSQAVAPTKVTGNVISATTTGDKKKKKKKKKKEDVEKKPKKNLRSAGGQVWEDPTLSDWDTNDFRLFCGDLGNDVTDEVLTRVFGRYPSFQKAKVVRDKRTNKTKGFGFVSFKDPNDFVRAIKEIDGRYVGSRPIKLRKSDWKKRSLEQARKRDKERNQLLQLIKK